MYFNTQRNDIQGEEGCFCDMLDVLLKEEVALKDEFKVPAVGAGAQSEAVDSEVEVFGCLEQVGLFRLV